VLCLVVGLINGFVVVNVVTFVDEVCLVVGFIDGFVVVGVMTFVVVVCLDVKLASSVGGLVGGLNKVVLADSFVNFDSGNIVEAVVVAFETSGFRLKGKFSCFPCRLNV